MSMSFTKAKISPKVKTIKDSTISSDDKSNKLDGNTEDLPAIKKEVDDENVNALEDNPTQNVPSDELERTETRALSTDQKSESHEEIEVTPSNEKSDTKIETDERAKSPEPQNLSQTSVNSCSQDTSKEFELKMEVLSNESMEGQESDVASKDNSSTNCVKDEQGNLETEVVGTVTDTRRDPKSTGAADDINLNNDEKDTDNSVNPKSSEKVHATENEKLTTTETDALDKPSLGHNLPKETLEKPISSAEDTTKEASQEAPEAVDSDKTETVDPSAATGEGVKITKMTVAEIQAENSDIPDATGIIEEVESITTDTPNDSTVPEPMDVSISESVEIAEEPEKEKQTHGEERRKSVTKMDVEAVDSDSDGENLFHDIPTDDWKQKNQKLVKAGSVSSLATERVDNESEAECDLILVDRDAWLAAKNMRSAKDTDLMDYDSDDTVVLKSRIDCMRDLAQNKKPLATLTEEDDIESPKKHLKRRSSLKEGSSLKVKKEDESTKTDKIDAEENEEGAEEIDQEVISKLNSSRKSLSRKSLSKSLIEVTDSAEEPPGKEKFNKSKILTASSMELNTSSKKEKKNQSLNTSLRKKIKPKPVDVEPDNESSESDVSEEDIPATRQPNGKKKKLEKNLSTIVYVSSNSDSQDSYATDSEESMNKRVKEPRFLLANADSDTDYEADGSIEGSIDSDIKREYNLDGKDISEYDDDDVPGDECRASESEYSDRTDNGSDLADFVVDDDDEVEEEEEEDDDEEEDEEGDQEDEGEDKEVNVENAEMDVEDTFSDVEPQVATINKALDELVEVLRRTAETIEANKVMKKRRRGDVVEEIKDQRDAKTHKLQLKNQTYKSKKTKLVKKDIKRPSVKILGSPSESPRRQAKKRKVLKENPYTLLSSQSTTHFDIVSLPKIRK